MPASPAQPTLPAAVDVREVGPRDGMQNEPPVPVAARVRLIDALSASGLQRIEAASFVHPDWIPAMAGADEVLQQIERRPGVRYTALVPNLKGAQRAISAGADELEVFVSVSETHNLKNIKRTPEETLEHIAEVVALAREAGTPVEAGVATSFGCPYEGDIDPARVADVAARILEIGAESVYFGDTTGMATPMRVNALVDALEAAGIEAGSIGLHFHDTRGTGLANAYAALCRGVTKFDASVGGLGGCPYAPGASGNIVTEDLIHMLQDMGIETGVDLDALLAAARLAQEIVGRDLPGAVLRAGPRTQLVG